MTKNNILLPNIINQIHYLVNIFTPLGFANSLLSTYRYPLSFFNKTPIRLLESIFETFADKSAGEGPNENDHI